MTLDENLDNSGLFVLKGFLSDEEVQQVTNLTRDEQRLRSPKCCVWYKSLSLIDNPDTKKMCHDICDSVGSGCYFAMYTPKGEIIDTARGNYD